MTWQYITILILAIYGVRQKKRAERYKASAIEWHNKYWNHGYEEFVKEVPGTKGEKND